MKVRREHWGAWVRTDDPPALVAIDRDALVNLGLSPRDEARVEPPLEAHVAVTSRCAAGCVGCYLDARPEGEHVPFDTLAQRLEALAASGVFTVAFGGGEPTTRNDLPALAARTRQLGMVPVLTTSGLGMTEARARDLRSFAQVNVSYDGSAGDYALVRGFDGADLAERAIAMLADGGVRVGVNVVLTRATFESIATTVTRAAELGAREAQLLRYKPAGRARSPDYLARRLTLDQRCALPSVLATLSHSLTPRGFRVRIDCALVPFFSADPDLRSRVDLLTRAGVLGCEAGAALAAVRVDGMLAPCSFSEASTADVTAMPGAWENDPWIERHRGFHEAPPEPCASCDLRAVCKGGCRVVALAAGSFGPDPECPRVEEFATRAAQSGSAQPTS